MIRRVPRPFDRLLRGEALHAERVPLPPERLGSAPRNRPRPFPVAPHRDGEVAPHVGDVRVREPVEPAHVDDVVGPLGFEHLGEHRLADAHERGRRREQHRHGLDVHDRPEVLAQHGVDQADGLVGAFVEVHVGVVVTGEHAVQRIGHRPGDVAVQVEHRRDRHGFPDQVAHRGREIAFEILQVLHHAGAVQVQEDAIDRTRRRDPGEDLLLEGLVRFRLDRARRLGIDDQDGRDLESQPLAGAHGATRSALRVALAQDRRAPALVECRRRGRVPAIGVRLVANARNRDARHDPSPPPSPSPPPGRRPIRPVRDARRTARRAT